MLKATSAVALAAAVNMSPVTAATIQDLNMDQNDWAVFEFDGANSVDLAVEPISRNGSFSVTYAFSGNGCGDNIYWTCIPDSHTTNTLYSDYSHNFGEGWFDKENLGSITSPFTISYSRETWDNLFVYFRVTSGSGSISHVEKSVSAPVPLPAAFPMLLAGLAGLGIFALRRRKAA